MANPCLNCTTQDCENCKIKPVNKCGEKTTVWSRVSGYCRPVSSWNKGKQEEFRDRKVFKTKLEKYPS
jgi:anaerobic ribonucleoside-triphosphate reductase